MKKYFFMLLLFSFSLQTARAGSLSDQPALNKDTSQSDVYWGISYSTGLFMFSHTLPGENEMSALYRKKPLVYKGVRLLAEYSGMYARAMLNIGFEKKPPSFSWQNLPNFQSLLNVIEFEAAFLLPIEFSWSYSLYPLIGYSYINYSFDKFYRRYHSLQFGFENIIRVSRCIRIDAFFRWSPITNDAVSIDFLASPSNLMTISALYGIDCMFTFGIVNLSVSLSHRDVFKTEQSASDSDPYDLRISKCSVSLKIRP